jgi:hypothetical protein
MESDVKRERGRVTNVLRSAVSRCLSMATALRGSVEPVLEVTA